MVEQVSIDVAKSLVKAYGDKDWGTLFTLVESGITYDEVPTHRKNHGYRKFMAIMQEWGESFPDSTITIKDTKVFGNNVMVDYEWRGTHDGQIDTPGGVIFPTGKKIDITGCMVIEVGEEKVKSIIHHFDLEKMENQLELKPEERAA